MRKARKRVRKPDSSRAPVVSQSVYRTERGSARNRLAPPPSVGSGASSTGMPSTSTSPAVESTRAGRRIASTVAAT